MGKTTLHLLQKQGGRCPLCGGCCCTPITSRKLPTSGSSGSRSPASRSANARSPPTRATASCRAAGRQPAAVGGAGDEPQMPSRVVAADQQGTRRGQRSGYPGDDALGALEPALAECRYSRVAVFARRASSPVPDHPCGCEYDDTPTGCSICQWAAEPAGVQQRVDRLTISLQRAALFIVGPIGNRAPPAGTR